MSLSEQIAVMQAANAGKAIESRSAGSTWSRCAMPVWNWAVFDYRVAKKTITVTRYHVVDHFGRSQGTHSSIEPAERQARTHGGHVIPLTGSIDIDA